MLNVLVFGMAIVLVIGFVGEPFGGVTSSFLLAGIVPGTSIQLPWYSMVLSAPLLLYGLYLFTRSHFNEQKPSKALLSVGVKKRTATPVVAHEKIQVKKSAAAARKAYAKAKRKPVKAPASRKLTHSKA